MKRAELHRLPNNGAGALRKGLTASIRAAVVYRIDSPDR